MAQGGKRPGAERRPIEDSITVKWRVPRDVHSAIVAEAPPAAIAVITGCHS